MESKITARIERRAWYVNGKYLGDKSPWIEVAPSVIADETTGHFYGEWAGTRFHDGHMAIAAVRSRTGQCFSATILTAKLASSSAIRAASVIGASTA